jgi:uncharacterized protein YvpB
MVNDTRSSQQRAMLSSPTKRLPAQTRLDTASFVLVALLVVGAIALGLAVWLVVTLPQQSTSTSGGDGSALWLRGAHASQTRDAQQTEIARLQIELDETRRQLATVSAQPTPTLAPTPAYEEAATVLSKPPLALILDAPVYQQAHSLSCESSAAAMAANYYGVGVNEETIIAALPRHDNPHLGFRGNIDGPYGGIEDYGVYAEPIRQILVQLGLEVEHLQDGTEEIRAAIRRGRVVIAWVTYNLQVETPQQVTTSDGQVVTLVPYQHVVLVTGYNSSGLWVNDPYSGTQAFYTEAEFQRAFAYLGNMALVVGPPEGR